MAFHFSANQYENQYTAKRLGNWEQPKWYPPRPRQRKGSTKIISNDAGHLLPTVNRVDNNPWGNFRSTYQLPDKLTRRFAKDYDDCLTRRDKWRHFPQKSTQICEDTNNNQSIGVTGTSIVTPHCQTKCETAARLLSGDKDRNRILHPCDRKQSLDLEYVPGDFTPAQQRHESRQLLLQQKYERDNDIEPELPLDKLYLGETDHECELEKRRPNQTDIRFTVPRPLTGALTTPLSPPLQDLEPFTAAVPPLDFDAKMPQQLITAKPNERCPSPVVPAYANFELARRMHDDNLDHQPLPDCVADMAYRKLQMTGGHGGLALDIDPIATGVGVKMHNAGPTHCTKMKVYRPKTCGVVPKLYDTDTSVYRHAASAQPAKKMGAMDLAICWDYKPSSGAAEPQRSRHIDGTNDSAGPAVFTYVPTPRDEPAANAATAANRSGGVFTNTVGELDFFDKDIMRRKTDFTGRNIELDADCACGVGPTQRVRSVSRDCLGDARMPSRYGKQYQSSPNVMPDPEYKALREKYLGGNAGSAACNRGNPGFFRRARTRLCHKVAPAQSACCHTESHSHCKPPLPAFRAGVPKYNAAGHFISSDSGCSMGSDNSRCKVISVPRPRNPYAKRNYDIDTLVPPFRSYGGGAGEGGYPEHWRLASVYQHAYKPLEQRRRPLLHSVYK